MLANITNWAIGIWFVVLDGDLDLHYVPDQEHNLDLHFIPEQDVPDRDREHTLHIQTNQIQEQKCNFPKTVFPVAGSNRRPWVY